MKLALLSNITISLLADMLGDRLEIYFPDGYDTWQQEIMLSSSGLYKSKPDAVAILIYADAFSEIWNDRNKGCQLIDEWALAIQMLSGAMPNTPIFVSSIDISPAWAQYGAETTLNTLFEHYFIEKIQKLHKDSCKNLYLLPIRDLISNIGREHFYSPKMWYIGSMPYSAKGLSALSGLILRYVSATKGASKKCIAVDLDNTLWGGVIGEDGVKGIQLSNTKEGARYKDTQRILKKMKTQGVLLAILSKNNPEDVASVFSHPDMILRDEDFVAKFINWEPKSINMKRLASDLNIGLDAFVFLDDNPAERELMKAECPEVMVVDFPKDTAHLPDVVASVYEQYFFSLEVTNEDFAKTAMYRSNVQRRIDQKNAASIGDYLKQLKMTMDIHIMEKDEQIRVTQLVNKSNQFNVTTKRYSEEEICALAFSKDSDIITIHMADKYGNQGLVSVLIVKYHENYAEIDTFLMSCRVMGRYAENEILARTKDFLKTKHIEKLKATYIKTAKNTPVMDLFDRCGFQLIKSTGDQKHYITDVERLPEKTGLFQQVLAFSGDQICE